MSTVQRVARPMPPMTTKDAVSPSRGIVESAEECSVSFWFRGLLLPATAPSSSAEL